jgi:hypothetical protein
LIPELKIRRIKGNRFIINDIYSETCTCKKALDNAIITNPEMRSEKVMDKLSSILKRLNNNSN